MKKIIDDNFGAIAMTSLKSPNDYEIQAFYQLDVIDVMIDFWDETQSRKINTICTSIASSVEWLYFYSYR